MNNTSKLKLSAIGTLLLFGLTIVGCDKDPIIIDNSQTNINNSVNVDVIVNGDTVIHVEKELTVLQVAVNSNVTLESNDGETHVWESRNPEIAVVNNNVMTALKEGNTELVDKTNSKKKITVNVVK